MNSQNLGIALTSEKINVGNKAIGISPFVYTYVEQEFKFTNGGTSPIYPGDVVRGTAAAAIVVRAFLDSGSWEENNACGTMRIKSLAGQWIIGDILSVGPDSDRVLMVSNPIECTDNYKFKRELAKVAYVSVKPSTDSLVDHAAVLISTDGSNLDRNYAMGHVLPEAKRWVLYGDEIPKAKFIIFIGSSKAVINVTAYF